MFHDLEMRWGAAGAYQYLVEVEKAAGILSREVGSLDPDIRLANAFRVQDSLAAFARAA